ncbi:MAG TPA: chemotaxis protein CheD [Anaeromyxobacteraceae bacterium]|nr:chemotaxis protein CheD [Anaeromyxobacteraceae bacterium]
MSNRLALDLPPSPARTGDVTLDLPGSDGRPRRSVYLHAGQVHAAGEPSSVVTVLGSCVAVCLCDREAAVGGMNHFLLPHATLREQSPRFGAVAMPQLLEQVLRLGARRERLEAKVFGGACVIEALKGRNLGSENVELALRVLRGAGIQVLERDVGGHRGRKLVFHTDVGAAWVRTL